MIDLKPDSLKTKKMKIVVKKNNSNEIKRSKFCAKITKKRNKFSSLPQTRDDV